MFHKKNSFLLLVIRAFFWYTLLNISILLMALNFEQLLEFAAQNGASDIHFTPGKAPYVRANGKLHPAGEELMDEPTIQNFLLKILDQRHQGILADRRQTDFVMMTPNKTRLRGNAFFQEKGLSVSLRVIPNKVFDYDGLGFPPFVKEKVFALRQGFILVVGPTGQGKTTTVTSIISERTNHNTEHVVTIEDPIEYLLESSTGIIQQREVGRDVLSFSDGIKAALREDPNVLMVGEMRDRETIESALTMSETGHVVFATLHTNNGPQTITRIIDVFAAEQQNQVRSQLADSLTMIISQRLIPSLDGKRVLAYEILTSNYAIQNYIRTNKIFQIPNVLQTDSSGEMVQFEQCLTSLVANQKISLKVAYQYCTDKDLLKSMLVANGLEA